MHLHEIERQYLGGRDKTKVLLEARVRNKGTSIHSLPLLCTLARGYMRTNRGGPEIKSPVARDKICYSFIYQQNLKPPGPKIAIDLSNCHHTSAC